MKLIKGVRVSGFRSIDDTWLSELAPFSVLVGRNNSGKSNVIRALNLFFSNQPEPGRPLDFGRDHHTIPERKKKEEIVVDVVFDLSEFNLRDDIRQQIHNGLGTTFTLRKKWGLTRQFEPVLQVEVRKPGDNTFTDAPEDVVRTLISLVNFRYIPNRTIPTETLASRRVEVARAISKRVERTEKEAAQNLVTRIKEAAAAALLAVDSGISGATEGISQIEAGISEAIPDLISLSNFRARTALGTSVADDAWGSGTQAFLMFSVLHAVDRDRSSYFGWRQGTVWAVEEPESSLHHDLAVALAERFHHWSNQEEDRLQILCTTHSEVFTMCADQGYEVTLAEGKTSATAKPIPLLASNAARSGVTSWPQPILAFPFNPIIFVEGTIDSRVLSHASKVVGVAANCVFLSPSELDPAASDGADSLASYLQKFGNLWQKRPPESPIVVLFDWDRANDQGPLTRARKVFGSEGSQRILVMDPSHCDDRMTDQWRGIERFYTPQFIEQASAEGTITAACDGEGRWLITQANLQAAKKPLASRICESANPDDFSHFKTALLRVEATIAALTAGYYQLAFGSEGHGV